MLLSRIFNNFLSFVKRAYQMILDSKRIYTTEFIEEKITENLKTRRNINKAKLDNKTSFTEMGMDTIGQLEFIGDLEEIFDIDISHEDALSIDNIEDAIRIFNSYLLKSLQA